jgi:pteridine reductase
MVALVTGGAVRIGRALALALAGRGAAVAVHYGTSAAAAAETVAAIRDSGGSAESFQADLRDFSLAERLIEQAAKRLGRLDILVNSAALFETKGFIDTTEQIWDEQFAVNLKAPFFLSRAFARQVGSGRPGQIVNIADWRAIRPDPRSIAYSMTKAGIVAMTSGLAVALAPNIRVNAIAPGSILPPPGRDESYLEEIGRRTPLQRHGSTVELARALLYLVTAEYVTGQVLFVDGGEHLGGSR